ARSSGQLCGSHSDLCNAVVLFGIVAGLANAGIGAIFSCCSLYDGVLQLAAHLLLFRMETARSAGVGASSLSDPCCIIFLLIPVGNRSAGTTSRWAECPASQYGACACLVHICVRLVVRSSNCFKRCFFSD